MAKNKFAAHYIFTGNGKVYKNGIVVTEKDGTIKEVIDTGGQLPEKANVKFYSGVIVPGFVNAHCHLELSHLRNTFPEKTGMAGFLSRIVKQREIQEDLIKEAARIADAEMQRNGIVAVGDIANNPLAFETKKSSSIQYHTFIEALGFSPARADAAFEYITLLQKKALELGLNASVVPHAPYSISEQLFRKIGQLALEQDAILTMHNQESKEENELYQTGKGKIAKHIRTNLGIDLKSFHPTGKNSLESVLPFLPASSQLLLVHNTFTGKEELDWLHANRDEGKTSLVLCPNSNLFIEDRLPDVELLRSNGLSICLGTDSLSSNHSLSVLDEMITLHQHFPDIPFGELVQWATGNGAKALRMDEQLGTIAPGKKPGLNLITGMDLQELKLLPGSRVKRLI